MKIPLTQAQIALVDDEDADLAEFKWCALKSRKTFYGKRQAAGRTEYLHKVIGLRMGIVGQVDHRDNNGLNCRRENLRPATTSENQANQPIQKNNTSGVIGVSWNKKRKRWQAKISIRGKQKHLGLFLNLFEAAAARDRAAVAAFGEFAVVN